MKAAALGLAAAALGPHLVAALWPASQALRALLTRKLA